MATASLPRELLTAETFLWDGPEAAFASTAIPRDPAELFPEEAGILARAVASRVRDYASGRWCGRRALELLGAAPVAIPTGRFREPVWPKGFEGSISHAGGRYCAVARPDGGGIGIDLESLDRRELPEIRDLILHPRERADAEGLEGEARRLHTAIIFSLKEAFFKAAFRTAGSYFGFQSVSVSLERESGTAELLVLETIGGGIGPGCRYQGRFLLGGGFVLSLVALP